MYKHFLRNFNLLNDRLKRADIPARIPIMQLMKENFSLVNQTTAAPNIEPFAYYTDGGTYNDEPKYFINNIFSRSGVCYSSKVPKNTNVQLYLGRKIEPDPSKVLPKDHKVKGAVNEICLPYEKLVSESAPEESFKLLSELVIHNMGSGYTCFVKAFCLFTSDREIKISKSPIVKFFDNINTKEEFEKLGLPIKN
jgi:hypothetical protein